jgi:hypothetical protein
VNVDNNANFAFNVMNIIYAFDEDTAEVKRFPSSGRIMRIIKHKFVPEKVGDQVIFKIPQDPGSIYVTDSFVKKYHEHRLTGLIFKEVWSNED